MRRIVPIVLALLVLLPTAVQAAVMYRCGHDGQIRKSCCCPAKAKDHDPDRDAAPGVKKSCCCTITTIKAPPPAARDVTPAATVQALPAAVAVASIDVIAPRPFRISDLPSMVPTGPPERLFVRNSALLL